MAHMWMKHALGKHVYISVRPAIPRSIRCSNCFPAQPCWVVFSNDRCRTCWLLWNKHTHTHTLTHVLRAYRSREQMTQRWCTVPSSPLPHLSHKWRRPWSCGPRKDFLCTQSAKTNWEIIRQWKWQNAVKRTKAPLISVNPGFYLFFSFNAQQEAAAAAAAYTDFTEIKAAVWDAVLVGRGANEAWVRVLWSALTRWNCKRIHLYYTCQQEITHNNRLLLRPPPHAQKD